MLSLTNSLKAIGSALNEALPGITYHYFRPANKYPVCVWQEDGEATSFYAEGLKEEQAISGTIDYFTKKEYDPNIDLIQDTLSNLPLTWLIRSVQYEDATKLIHYEWQWETRING